MTIWSHPLDFFFTTTSMTGWPKIAVQVFKIDSYGGYDLGFYSFSFYVSFF